ncbi:exopolyphosphatase [Ferrimonas gelatinilytica]|uniref:Exopolyphosphatase n=1 Tax=Ferrimonas gelatinilytica TaxID=1255257 RepID=A0ABP9RV74_9GAMM
MGANAVTADGLEHSGPLLAAVTLGSNSFNLLLARPGQPLPTIIAKHKRKVRLAQGLGPDGSVCPSVEAGALECLAWFGQLLKQYRPVEVAVYATAALRQSKDPAAFCHRGQALLGHPIEIISGEREATYIYQGMRATTAVEGRALVLDIGGASTELVIGDASIRCKHSLPLGAVLYTQHYFSGGVTATALEQAKESVAQALKPILAELHGWGWDAALGISGTFRSLFELIANRGWSDTALTPALLMRVEQELIALGSGELDDLEPERGATFAAGVAILSSLLAELKISAVLPAGGALREGVLVELDRRIR